ncbi:MAG: hypothetical protein IKT93_04725 [Clostridia bacterium]|nr:hypothetical protein [Clostridia bacterium]
MITVKEVESYKNYGKCVSISNGVIEAYVTIDIGPRIIKFGYVDGQNFMCDEREEFGYLTDEVYENFFGKGRRWENLGGHRIWLSPESYPETYLPDDRKVEYTVTDCGAVFNPLADTEIGAQKTLEIKMDADDANMQVIMDIKNIGTTPKEFAIWSLSVCSQDGTLVIPTNTNDTGLLPNRTIVVWPYTDLTDDRIFFGKRYATIKQNKNATTPVKLGFDVNAGTAYYVKNGEILCKNYETKHPHAKYPDNGCSFETYTNGLFLEFETLGELKEVAVGETSRLVERWSLCKQPCEADFKNDDSIDNLLSKI